MSAILAVIATTWLSALALSLGGVVVVILDRVSVRR